MTRLTPRLLIGLAILTLGFVLLLDNMDLWDASDGLRIWMSGLLVALGVMIWKQLRLVGVGLIFLGVWSGLSELFDAVSWDEDLFWPLIFVFFGANMVYDAVTGRRRGSGPLETESRFFTVAFWSGVGRKVSSSDFKSGEAVAVMGACTVDLRSSFITEGEAEIFVFAMWGGVEILVPEDWSVVNKGFAIMGGFDDASQPPRGGSKQRLVVHGAAVMGAAEISNHEEEDD